MKDICCETDASVVNYNIVGILLSFMAHTHTHTCSDSDVALQEEVAVMATT